MTLRSDHHRMVSCCFITLIETTAICLLLCWKLIDVHAQSAVYPTIRFATWEQNKYKEAANILGYNSTSWNNPGTNPMESLTYEMIVIDRANADALDELEIDKQSWDCYINHYRGYSWPDLTNTYKNAYRTLGWTHVSWNQISDPPESESIVWDVLNSDEQDAAKTLCYIEELWDSIPLYEWNNENSNSIVTMNPSTYPTSVPSCTPSLSNEVDPTIQPSVTSRMPSSVISRTDNPTSKETTAPSSNPSLATFLPSLLPTQLVLSASVLPTILPTTQLTIPIPYFRYVPWTKLNDNTRTFAVLLGYSQDVWDVLGSATIEHMSFDMIFASNESTRIAYIQALGFSKPSWDCYMTHYRAFSWGELNDLDVQQYYETLGWTEQQWNNSDVPRTEVLPWNDLNFAERIAAESLCYFEPIWNNVSLQDNVAWRLSPSSSSFSLSAYSWASLIATILAHI